MATEKTGAHQTATAPSARGAEQTSFMIKDQTRATRPASPQAHAMWAPHKAVPSCWPVSGLKERRLRPSQKPRFPVVCEQALKTGASA